MLYTEEAVRANIRNRDGKRVFFLDPKDTLTSGARDWLQRQRIQIRPASEAPIATYKLQNGGIFHSKPEQYTHLHSDVLVPKTHPRIHFRGAIDTLEAELLLCYSAVHIKELLDILELARHLIRCEVMDEPVQWETLCGLTEIQLRQRSHHPQEYYGQPHFMPGPQDPPAVLQLNRCRCAVRTAELAAAHAFMDPEGNCTRPDILKALNRMSSTVYILMIQAKANEL